MELQQDNEKTKVDNTVVKVPDIKYKSLEDAEKILKEAGLKIKYNEDAKELNKKETVIASQIPSAGINVNAESTVFVTLE